MGQALKKIRVWAERRYRALGARGERFPLSGRAGGAATNICAFFFPGGSCKGCGELANDTLAAFDAAKGSLDLDDTWVARPVDDSDGPLFTQDEDPSQTNLLPHSAVELRSSNPLDPKIRLDPHRALTSVQP